jgi:hypothetical protein
VPPGSTKIKGPLSPRSACSGPEGSEFQDETAR